MYITCDNICLRKINDKLVFVNIYKSSEIYVIDNVNEKVHISDETIYFEDNSLDDIFDSLVEIEVLKRCKYE